MKIIIHAGIQRTGTTSLQSFLEKNRQVLMSYGVNYLGNDKNHQNLAWSLYKNPNITKRELVPMLEAANDCDTVVLSAEDFCVHTNLDWLKDIAETWPTQVLFHLRRQDHWMMSWYNLNIKWPFNPVMSKLDKQGFLEKIDSFHWLNYAELIERWTSVLGSDHVSVAIIEKDQVVDVIESFFSRLNIPRENIIFEDARKNDSLPVHLLEIARNLGIYELPTHLRIKLIGTLKKSLAHKKQSASTIFSPAERLWILDRYNDSNHQVAVKKFQRDRLFFEPYPTSEDEYFEFPQISQEDLLREWIAPIVKNFLNPR